MNRQRELLRSAKAELRNGAKHVRKAQWYVSSPQRQIPPANLRKLAAAEITEAIRHLSAAACIFLDVHNELEG